MSHSVVVLFLFVLVGIYTISGQVTPPPTLPGCDERCEENLGCCFGTQENLALFPKCNYLIENYRGCPRIGRRRWQTCCVDCNILQATCTEAFYTSVARGPTNVPGTNETQPCCPSELVVNDPYPESDCKCCIKCTRNKRKCRSRRGSGKSSRCVTEEDPYYNFAWCTEIVQGTLQPDWCEPDGCACCHDYTPIP